MISIRDRYFGNVLFECGATSMLEAVRTAIDACAPLVGANLTGADLDGVHLEGAVLVGVRFKGASLKDARFKGARLGLANLDAAQLQGADLEGADLVDASLSRARLNGARLVGAALSHADLTYAQLAGASLVDADVAGVYIRGASGVDLDGANLAPIKIDLHRVLDAAPAEVPTLLEKLRAGKLDGNSWRGEHCCLFGTILTARGVRLDDLSAEKEFDDIVCRHKLADRYNYACSRFSSPAEDWFMALAPGDTPSSHPVAKLTETWIEEWLARRGAA